MADLSERQWAFIREKALGLCDKDAAIAAGYSLSIAENTKQKIWSRPGVRWAFEQLREQLRLLYGLAGHKSV